MNMERYVELDDGKKIQMREGTHIRRDYFWPWEYWALKEHMAMERCETWVEYVIESLMRIEMPSREDATEPEIDSRPGEDDEKRNIIIRFPANKLATIDRRRTALLRTWREFLLYGALKEGLIADHYYEITGEEWPLRDSNG